MSTEGLIGYETLIEHHKKHHKDEDALRAEVVKWQNVYETESKLRRQDFIEADVLRSKLEIAKEALEKYAADKFLGWIAKEALQKLEG